MKVALVYDRVNKWGGAERVLLALNEIFPDAPLFTSVYDAQSASWASCFPEVIPSFLQNIPFATNNHEYLAPLMPISFEHHNLSDYEVIISVSSEAAKGVLTNHKQKHICYLLTPTRYLWSGHNDYFKSRTKKLLASPALFYLKKWDRHASSRPDLIVSISQEVRRRAKKYYNRDTEVVYPPFWFDTGVKKYNQQTAKPFLVVSRLVPYKKVDLVVKAFNKLGLPLVVIGEGREKSKLEGMAGRNISFVSKLTDDQLINYYANSRALLFPQVEDFGLVAVEAQSFGTPVIAYAKGGALETVVDGETGILFDSQTPEGIIKATYRFLDMSFKPKKIIANSARFSKERFQKEFLNLVNNL